MTGIGESLRQARLDRRLSLEQAAAALNLRARYLGDLEAERFERLPSPFYARGFLREYAELLGLDADLLLALYHGKHSDLARPEIVARPTAPRPRRGLVPGRRAAAAIAIAIAALTVWAFGQTPERGRLGTLAQRPAATPSPAGAKRPVRQPVATPPAVAVLRAARGDCWLSVRVGSRTGAVLFEGMLDRGKAYRIGLRRPLWIRLGAPWNVDLRVRGKPAALPAGTQPVNVTLSRSRVATA